MTETLREPAFICKRSGFVDNECCEPCNCAEIRRIIDAMGVHSYHGSEGIVDRLRIRLPNNDWRSVNQGLPVYQYWGVDFGKGVDYTAYWKPPPPTRWQRFKRRWSDRLERVADAWAVLRGKKQTRDEDDY